METIDDNWVNNECGDFMWDDALATFDQKLNNRMEINEKPMHDNQEKKMYKGKIVHQVAPIIHF